MERSQNIYTATREAVVQTVWLRKDKVATFLDQRHKDRAEQLEDDMCPSTQLGTWAGVV